MSVIEAIEAIGRDPAVRNGRAYVLGTTVTVADVAVIRLYHGLDADAIAEWYGLSLAQTYAALAYYYGRKAEIDEQVREQIRRAELLKEQRIGGKDSLLPG